MLELNMLPARQGDAIWIRWGNEEQCRQLMIDMGTEEIGRKIRNRLLELPASQRKFELLVITHVDRDHIGGVLTCLAESAPIESLEFKDIWFNGWVHLNGGNANQSAGSKKLTRLESFGPAQGERLSNWLYQKPWNLRFSGGPVIRKENQELESVTFPGGLKLTILGPTQDRLTNFAATWREEVNEALEKGKLYTLPKELEVLGSKEAPILDDLADLEYLANSNSGRDTSEANGSSIALLLEYQEYRIVLAGDAWGGDLKAAFRQLSPNSPLKLDAFKLPHHASKNNITQELIEAVDCSHWLISTDGTQFRHPDAIAIARILHFSRKRNILSFNVRSEYNEWWDNSDWRTKFNYKTQYGCKDNGLTLQF